MKNILFVLNDFKFGGLTKVNTVIANELAKDHQVTIYNSGAGNCRFPLEVPVYQETYRAGKLSYYYPRIMKKLGQVTGIPLNPAHFEFERIQKLCAYIEAKNIDVVILNSSQILYATELKKRFPNLRIIGWLHNNAEIYLNKYFRSFKKHFLESVRQADFLICLTHADKASFDKSTDNAICIYNPLSIDSKKKANLHSQTIAFVGRIDIDQKGIDYLCKIATHLPPNWRIKVAGPGRKKDKKTFNKLQRKHQTIGKLEYVGSLRGKKLQKHYEESSIFMMTSRWEGMPLVLPEAMNFGLPIIAFKQSGANEALDHGKYGILVQQGSIEEFTVELSTLIESLEKRQEYSEKSLARLEVFSLDKIMSQWKTIIG